MRQFRIEMTSTEPASDYWFVIYEQAMNEHEALTQASNYKGFEPNKYTIVEVM